MLGRRCALPVPLFNALLAKNGAHERCIQFVGHVREQPPFADSHDRQDRSFATKAWKE